ncbi:abortive infection family protein [Planococcus sp. FY231025]|uniref:abortive infection family protein n=1 Tax=Planococcus sp. FY231025 TaxID=3455699 RepID=UPI003F9234D3
MTKLKRMDIQKIMTFIGGEGGYLGDFTYRKLEQFYIDNELDIEPFGESYFGTAKNRFEKILTESEVNVQAKIIQGILERYPTSYFEDQLESSYITFSERDFKKKEELREILIQLVDMLKGEIFEFDNLKHDKEFVRSTLEQAKTLITNHSYSTAVDRTHSAIHYYLKDLCKEEGITFDSELVKIQDVWSKMKTDHPNFNVDVKDSQKPINQTVNAISKFLENINDVRNKYVYAHPTDDILGENEARFVINIAYAILFYIDGKTQKL